MPGIVQTQRKEKSSTPRSAVWINLYLFVHLLVYYYEQLFALEGKFSQFKTNEVSVLAQRIAYRKHGNVFLIFMGALLKFQVILGSYTHGL